MSTTKTFLIAALTVFSLGAGAAMAQESAGGVGAGPWETHELNVERHAAALAAQNGRTGYMNQTPQYGSSERVQPLVPNLEGADGNGG